MRKKGKEIIRPVGVEIREYLNDGWGICNNCGALMDEEIELEYSPARHVAGSAMLWIMSTRRKTLWNSYRMKEVTST